MKNRFYRLPLKALAIALATLVMIFTSLSIVTGAMVAYGEYYTRPLNSILKDAYRDILEDRNYETLSYVVDLQQPERATEFSSRYYYTVADVSGRVIAGNYTGQNTLVSAETVIWSERYIPGKDYYLEEEYTVTGYLGTAYSEMDVFAVAENGCSFFYQIRFWIWVWAALGLLTEVALLVYLFCSAGNHPGEDAPRLNPLDKIPFDIATLALVAVAVSEFSVLVYMSGVEVAVLMLLFGTLDYLLLLWYFLSLATRLKVGILLHTTLFGKFFIWIGKGIKAFFRWVGYLFSNLPLVWKTSLFIGTVTFLELIVLLAVWNKALLLVLWLLEKLILVPMVIIISISLRKIQRGGEKLAAGNLDERLHTGFLLGDFKRFGYTLNSIGAGMNRAVEERMKSERFKTELITNVSHDIKTPLTSIINYVDLIKKEEPENEAVREYVEVLDRQSARLKKLIEDLVEASKASTGNLAVHPEPCDAGVLLTQLAGEYDERFRQNGLEPVLNLPEESIMVMADPRHFWRILDNLMVNIVKYAQKGTRVYLDLFAGEQEVALLFRNISKAPLNITGEELLERFIRGDSSRNTEGSGLGLSIAQSLAELQGGRLQIEVDGDLFKVMLRFPRLRE